MKTLLGAALLAAAAWSAAAAAQTLYKCSADGHTSYQQTPCASGQSVELSVPPAPAQSAADAANLARQRRGADEMERDRLRREAGDERARARAAQAGAAHRKKCTGLQLERKWAAEDVRAASHQNADKARLKARRADEKLAVECPL
ncbi:hypothetical protein ACFDR9_000257 [Janthinobacterium sp. CG_23.3]|uniref:DUF4124 domain-containing protein n=1 Tax=Janthinobacterium sp. CG_23.3 TaxID=3349634 RepID=UPI0038D4A69E